MAPVALPPATPLRLDCRAAVPARGRRVMATGKPRRLIEIAYESAAQDYLRSLPLEHFMEATSQATQRKITLECLDLLKVRRADVHVFNEKTPCRRGDWTRRGVDPTSARRAGGAAGRRARVG